MKRILLINMISPAIVNYLYISRMVIGMGKIYPLVCGVFVLGSFLSGIQYFFPNVFSSSDIIPI